MAYRTRPVHRRLPHLAEARSRPRRSRAGPRSTSSGCCNNKDFVEKYCGDKVERGLKVLYEDPELKFQVLAHINDKARVSPPHDHGESWAIYGQATLWTDMIEWKREDDGSDPKHAKLEAGEEIPAHARPRRHLPGRRDPLDRLSGQVALRARDRHQPRQHQPHPDRSEDRRSAPDDAAAGDVAHLTMPLHSTSWPGLCPAIHVFGKLDCLTDRGCPGQA